MIIAGLVNMAIMKKIDMSEKFPIYNFTKEIDGKIISRDIIKRPDISAILAIDNDMIIIEKNDRFPNGIDIEIPSGNIEEGEEPIDCAKRELKEETGYVAESMIEFTKFYTSIGYSTQIVHCFVAKGLDKKSEQKLDEGEYITIEKTSLENMLKMIKEGTIVDSITLSSVLTYVIKNELTDF